MPKLNNEYFHLTLQKSKRPHTKKPLTTAESERKGVNQNRDVWHKDMIKMFKV